LLQHNIKHNVIIVGVGKSGTTLLYHLIKEQLACSDSTLLLEAKVEQEGCGNIISKQLIGTFLEPEGPRLGRLLGADIVDQIICSIVKTFDKRIFIIRDPRDNLISRFFWYHSFKNFNGYERDFKSSLELIKQKEQSPCSISFRSLIDNLKNAQNHFHTKVLLQHQYIYNEVIRYILDKNIWKIVKYEDIIQGNMSELEEYLGVKLSKQIDLLNLNFIGRTKSYDNWRIFLTQEDVDWLKPVYSNSLKELGYNNDDWDLTPVPHLNPLHGSRYVEALYHKR